MLSDFGIQRMVQFNKAVCDWRPKQKALSPGFLWPAWRRKNIHAPKAQNDGRTRGRPNPQAAPKSLATTSSRSELDCLLPFWGDPLMGCFLLDCSSFFLLYMPKSTWPPCDQARRITLQFVDLVMSPVVIRRCPMEPSDYLAQIYSGHMEYYQNCCGTQTAVSGIRPPRDYRAWLLSFYISVFFPPCVTLQSQVFQDRYGNCPLGSGPSCPVTGGAWSGLGISTGIVALRHASCPDSHTH